jgi:hypothetical protein
VLAVFDRVCDIVVAGEIVALVLPQVGNGPLNVVVAGAPGAFSAVEAGSAAVLTMDRIDVSELHVSLQGAMTWEPCPDWPSLRARQDRIASRLPALQSLCRQHTSHGLLALLQPVGLSATRSQTVMAARRAAEALEGGLTGDRIRLREGVTAMAGLGGGLTPGGDDFLVGMMAWLWLVHPEPDVLCQHLVEIAAGLTTTLSAAFLRAAACGECSEAWHVLLAALSAETDGGLAQAARDLLAYGATSGADALAGFLWAAG